MQFILSFFVRIFRPILSFNGFFFRVIISYNHSLVLDICVPTFFFFYIFLLWLCSFLLSWSAFDFSFNCWLFLFTFRLFFSFSCFLHFFFYSIFIYSHGFVLSFTTFHFRRLSRLFINPPFVYIYFHVPVNVFILFFLLSFSLLFSHSASFLSFSLWHSCFSN